MPNVSGPIADLSYRNYDGPMLEVGRSWWVIAKMSMRLALKNRIFWVWATLSAFGYILLSIILYVMDATRDIQALAHRQQPSPLDAMVWKDQFLFAFGMGQLWLFILTLLIGSGIIAADNRANALLVYLSKPCSKLEYLVGKWLAMFLLITAVTGIPSFIFLGFSWLSYRQYGVWDSWIFFKLILLAGVPGVIHASIMLGISSLFNQARLAGVTYAGLYFLSIFVATVFTFMWIEGRSPLAGQLTHSSVGGLIDGMGKIILGSDGGLPLMMGRKGMQQAMNNPPIPSVLPFTIIFFLVCALFLYIAWRKVRAVEVVGK
jgi:ABC-2 type transport system permease protein